MGLNDILNTARDALAAQTFGLTVTGQNVANVNTPGYVRREALLETHDMGPNNFGSVNVAGIRRVADEFIDQRHLALTGETGAASERDRLLGQVEAMFNEAAGTGLGDSLSELFSSFSALSSLPTDDTTRASVLQRAQTFAERVRSTSDQLQDFRGELFAQARDMTESINSTVDAIAELSGRINVAQAGGNEPADLKDRRDALLLELSEMVEVRTFTDGNGQLVVQGPGVTLIQGDSARSFDLGVDGSGNLQLLAQTPTGASSNVTSFLSGGKLAGIFSVRDSDVTQTLNDLDEFAFGVASEINLAHAAGFGLDGTSGRNLFDVGGAVSGAASTLSVDSAVAGQPELVAASSSAAGVPGDAGAALLLARVAEAPIASLGGLDPGQANARLVGRVAQLKASAEQDLSTREAMTAQVEELRQSVSGVSLDEEMVSLTKYQRAFEAASRVFTTADQLLQELINTLGR